MFSSVGEFRWTTISLPRNIPRWTPQDIPTRPKCALKKSMPKIPLVVFLMGGILGGVSDKTPLFVIFRGKNNGKCTKKITLTLLGTKAMEVGNDDHFSVLWGEFDTKTHAVRM